MIKEFFAGEGPLSKEFSSYECRPQQVAMADFVADCAEDGANGMVEAGTGVGKSLGYLVPLIQRISERLQVPIRSDDPYKDQDDDAEEKMRPHRVVVSTASKNLQAQLMTKELPLLKKFFPKIEFAMAMGMENYLCGARLKSALGDDKNPLLAGMGGDLEMIAKWAKTTPSGLRQDLPHPVDNSIWTLVNRQADLCKCKTHDAASPCFYRKARLELQRAHVIIVNHYLLMAHLTTEGGRVIPQFDYLVCDEAHSLADVADGFFGHDISNQRVDRLIKDVHRVLRSVGDGIPRASEVHEIYDEIAHSSEKLFDMLRSMVEAEKKESMRLRGSIISAEELSQVEMIHRLKDASEWLKAAADYVQDEQKAMEVRSLARRSLELKDELASWLLQDDENLVYQVILEKKGRRICAKSNPLDLAPYLKPALFDQDFPAICTSATIATGGNMKFIKGKLGADTAKELVLASPFNYAQQAVFYVASDLPQATGNGNRDFDAAAGARAIDLIKISRGRTLVLCTSILSMRHIGGMIRGAFPELNVLVQGEEMERHKMIEALIGNPKTIVVGVDSMWQGVDVPGEALVMVIIVKLPFPYLGDPLFEARAEKVDSMKRSPKDFMGSSFMKISVPEATIKLKQGFGRLIRTSTDWGCVALLDSRIATRYNSYGRIMVASLPAVPISQDIGQVKAFFDARKPTDPPPPAADDIDEVPF